jgi:molybdate transport system substrate-binding protein
MNLKFLILSLSFVFLPLTAKPLLLYCGATMVLPMQRIGQLYTQQYGQEISIIQGGSGELLKTLMANHKGDLYLPGNPLYITQTQIAGLFPTQRTIGSMQISLFVRRGNPDGLHGLDDFLRHDIRFAIGSPKIGSIGKSTQKLLISHGGESYANSVGLHALYFATDSRDMNCLFRDEKIDAGLNWKPALLPLVRENKIDLISLPPQEIVRTPLILAMIRYTHQQQAAQRFIRVATSPQGQKILREAGFDILQ